MTNEKMKQFGKLAPQYNYSLNPYPSLRFSKCPMCEKKTGQRKLPLLVHVDPAHLISLNYTNRYCSNCELLIGHKHEIEHHLAKTFSQLHPQDIGNKYLIIGTVEKKSWRAGLKEPHSFDEIIENTHDFKNYEELRMTMAGWFDKAQSPPVMKPSLPTEWVK